MEDDGDTTSEQAEDSTASHQLGGGAELVCTNLRIKVRLLASVSLRQRCNELLTACDSSPVAAESLQLCDLGPTAAVKTGSNSSALMAATLPR